MVVRAERGDRCQESITIYGVTCIITMLGFQVTKLQKAVLYNFVLLLCHHVLYISVMHIVLRYTYMYT